MLPWFLAFGALPIGGAVETRSQNLTLKQQVAIETLEVRHSNGINARPGDQVTVRYRLSSDERLLVDSEQFGITFTFVLGDDEVPYAFQSGVVGLQVKGFRKARTAASAFGQEFVERWPDVKRAVTFEITLLDIVRPATP